ncbi:Uncharacterised protein [Mycobacteroides abscessus subsp. massiliense]|nr:Uncharacterised protein [Mycobacteroides abscessus subsp. massiliense]
MERETRSGQLLKHHGPIAGVPGVLSLPHRRRGRQRQKVRVVVEHRGDDRHHLVLGGDTDVHVHAPDQHLPSPPLRPGNQLVVSRRIGELLRGPAGEGVCTGTEQLHAHGLHDRTNGGQGCLQVAHRLADRPADTRHHLNGVT